MRACALRSAFARAARGRVSGSGPLSRTSNGVRAPANGLRLNDIASRNGPR
jgi:hypothetical protein